jgi:hypothetical protein
MRRFALASEELLDSQLAEGLLGSVNEFEVPRLDPWFGFLADTGVTSLFA